MAPHSGTLAWKIPWVEEPGRLRSMGSLESDTTDRLHFHFSLSCIGEGNGNPLQCSCLENPRDGGAWWTAVHEVARSRTRLKRLSRSSSISDWALYFKNISNKWEKNWRLQGICNKTVAWPKTYYHWSKLLFKKCKNCLNNKWKGWFKMKSLSLNMSIFC